MVWEHRNSLNILMSDEIKAHNDCSCTYYILAQRRVTHQSATLLSSIIPSTASETRFSFSTTPSMCHRIGTQSRGPRLEQLKTCSRTVQFRLPGDYFRDCVFTALHPKIKARQYSRGHNSRARLSLYHHSMFPGISSHNGFMLRSAVASAAKSFKIT